MNSEGEKILLPRSGPDDFWQMIHRCYSDEQQQKWKQLAMLALRENSGWLLDDIGKAFGHPKGHVSRCLKRIKKELKRRIRLAPTFLELPECDDFMENQPLTEQSAPDNSEEHQDTHSRDQNYPPDSLSCSVSHSQLLINWEGIHP